MEVYSAVLTERGNVTEIVGVFSDLSVSFTALRERMEETWELWSEGEEYPEFIQDGFGMVILNSEIGGYIQSWSL